MARFPGADEVPGDPGLDMTSGIVASLIRGSFAKIILPGIAVLLSVSLIEILLAILGQTTETQVQVTHPPSSAWHVKHLETEYTVRTNSEGLRSPEIPLAKPPHTLRVYIAGDSAVEGAFVSNDETFPVVLQGMLSSPNRPVQVVNGGLSGTGPLQYGRTFFHVGRKYSPDILLIGVNPNDLSETPLESKPVDLHTRMPVPYVPRTGWRFGLHYLWPRLYIRMRAIPAAIARGQHAVPGDFLGLVHSHARALGMPDDNFEAWKNSIPQPLLEAAKRGELGHNILSFGLFYPDRYIKWMNLPGEDEASRFETVTSLLTELVRIARNENTAVGVIFIPPAFLYDASAYDRDSIWRIGGTELQQVWLHGKTELQKRLDGWASELNVPYLDLTEGFRSATDGGTRICWRYDDHWRPVGHRVAADRIAAWMRAHQELAVPR